MMTTNEIDYITAVFPNFLQPIADLSDRMLQLPSGEPNEVQTSVIENGYAIAVIGLTAFLLEGACGRARYVAGLDQEGKRWSAVETLRELAKAEDTSEREEASPEGIELSIGEGEETPLAEKIEEIFAVRHAIAHAHLWKAKVDEIDLRFIEPPVRLPGYGDKNFDKIVDPSSRTTRKLKLDVFPTRIHRGTAITVLKECAKALESLESKHKEFFLPLRHRTIRLGDKSVPFYKWARELQ
jgi:hypothetical protein